MKRVLKILFTFLLILSGLVFFQKTLKRYETYSKFSTFFKEKDRNYDVYFFGTSHVLNAVFPMQLWKDYGITGYNMAWHSTPIATSYWQMRMACEVKKPKYVFIDILRIEQNELYNQNLHQIMDYYPLTKTKVEAIRDFFPDLKDGMEYYFPFIYCHNTWTDIRNNFFDESRPTLGADLRIDIKNSQYFTIEVPEYAGIPSTGMEYARKIISWCRNQGIVPVFYLIPYLNQGDMDEWKAAFFDFLKNENVPCFEFPEDLVDYEMDLYDQNSHLNPSGARKVTDFIGKYLVENFNITDHRNDSAYERWNQDYAAYEKFYDGKLKSEKNLDNLLMLLGSGDYFCSISIDEGCRVSELEEKLIGQIDCHRTVEPLAGCTFCIKIYRRKNRELICQRIF